MTRKNLIKGAIILAAAGITAKFLGFFFRIPLIYMIGEEGIGLYQLTYPLYTFILAIAAGIPIAISKMISERIALNKNKEAHRIFKLAFFIMLIFGSTSSLLLIVFSKQIINAFSWSSQSYFSLLGISLAPFFTCILSCFKGYFQGLQNMTPPAWSQIFEQLTRIFVGVGLAYFLLPLGIDKAAGGAAFGAVAGSFVGIMWMLLCFSKKKIRVYKGERSEHYTKLICEILRIAIPISIGQCIGSVMALIDSIMVPGLLLKAGLSYQMSTKLYGQLTGKAFVLVAIPLTLSIALSQSTVPAVSESFAIGDIRRFSTNVKNAYKFAMIVALPCCSGLFALAKPIMSFVFQNMSSGWELMQILSLGAVFIILAQTSTSILNGIGKTVLPVLAMIAGCIVKVIISMVFIPMPQYNIFAAAFGTLFSYAIVAFLDLCLVLKHTKLKIELKDTFLLPLLCSTVMMISVVLIYYKMYNLTSSNNKAVFVTTLMGIIIYAFMLSVTKTLNLKNLRKSIF